MQAARPADGGPQLEGFRARGVEVLLLPDPVDSFWVTADEAQVAYGFVTAPKRSGCPQAGKRIARHLRSDDAPEHQPAMHPDRPRRLDLALIAQLAHSWPYSARFVGTFSRIFSRLYIFAL